MLTFTAWNGVGGGLWGTGLTLMGYFLGSSSVIGKNLELVALVIIGISVIPIARELLRGARARRNS